MRDLLTSSTVSKVSGTKEDDMFFNSFSSVTRASISMSSCNSAIVLCLKEKVDSSSPLAAAKITCSKLYVRMAIVLPI